MADPTKVTTIFNYIGISTDTKPTAGVPVGAKMYEYDTGNTYVYTPAGTWVVDEEGGGEDSILISAIVNHRENVTAEDGTTGPDNDNASWQANPGGKRYFSGHAYFAYRADAGLTVTLRPWYRDPTSKYISRGDSKDFAVPDVTVAIDDDGTNMTATALALTDTDRAFTAYKSNNSLADYYIADANEGIGWIGTGGAATVANIYTTPRLNSNAWAVGGTPTNGGAYQVRKAVPFEITVDALGQDVFIAVEAVGGAEGAFTCSIYGIWA